MAFPAFRPGHRRWSPERVSRLGFLALVVVVALLGLIGNYHIVRYLEAQLIEHGVEHLDRVADGLRKLLQPTSGEAAERGTARFEVAMEQARGLGVSVFLVDDRDGRLLGDGIDGDRRLITRYRGLWRVRDGAPVDDPLAETEPMRALDREGRVWLVRLVPLAGSGRHPGVRSELAEITASLSTLHRHIDGTLLLVGGGVTLLGFAAMRRLGRGYEIQLERELAERTQALERSQAAWLHQARLAAIGQTASMLAHEMRNPLASIKLGLAGIRDGGVDAPNAARRLAIVLRETDRLEGLLNDTLDYVRPVRRSARAVSVDTLLDRAIGVVEPRLATRRVSIARSACAGCPDLHLDDGQIHQVLLNLLINAEEASEEGGRITVRLEPWEEGVRLTVANGGETIDAAIRERIFEPFFTTKPRGTGLGLGLVKRVVEEHGGSVHVEGGNETVVWIELPDRPSAASVEDHDGWSGRVGRECRATFEKGT